MSESIVREHATIDFGSLRLTGTLIHDDVQRALFLLTDEGPEALSISLQSYGLVAEPGCVFIKDWSEHSGLSNRLVTAGLVRIQHLEHVGPFNLPAFEVQVLR